MINLIHEQLHIEVSQFQHHNSTRWKQGFKNGMIAFYQNLKNLGFFQANIHMEFTWSK